uniref:Uncharacterized protein n=2 Tax=Arion vulgaris TaxID=1028688 RepID=A0A0B7BS94_9EUPU
MHGTSNFIISEIIDNRKHPARLSPTESTAERTLTGQQRQIIIAKLFGSLDELTNTTTYIQRIGLIV